MATKDLGTIQVPVNTNTREPRSATPDLLRGLIGPAAQVGAEIRNSVDTFNVGEGRGEMEADVNAELVAGRVDSTVDEAAPDFMGPPSREFRPGTGNDRADSLVADIMRLERVTQQAPSNKKGRAQLQMRDTLQQLRMERPRLAKALEGELSSIERYDPEFALLGVMDASALAGQARAVEELDRYKAFAYDKTLANGGWGLNPIDHPFGSNTFALAAQNAAGKQSFRAQNDVQLAAVDSQENLDVKNSAAVMQDYLMGSASYIKVAITDYDVMLQELGTAYMDLNNPNNVTTIENYTVPGGQLDEMVRDIDLWSLSIENSLQTAFPANQQDSPEFTAMRQATNQQLQALEGLKTGLRTKNAGMVNAWSVYEASVNFKFEHDFPKVATMIRNLNRVAPAMEAMKDDLSGRGDVFLDEVAKAMNDSAPAVFGRILGLDTASGVNSDMTPQQVRKALRGVSSDNEDMYDTHIPSPRNNQKAAIYEAENLNMPIVIDRARMRTEEPEVVEMVTNAMALSLDNATIHRDLDPAAQFRALQAGAPPGFRHVIAQTNETAPNYSRNWANSYEDLFKEYKPNRDAQFKADASLIISEGSKVTVGETMLLDTDRVSETGEVRFSVNDQFVMATVRASLDARQERPQFSSSRFSVGSNESAVVQQEALLLAADSAAEMSARVSAELKTHAEFRAAKRGSEELDYAEAWDQGGFDDVFGPLVIEE